NPWEILAITFTNKAANELKERLEKVIGSQNNEIWASTFHSFCSRILRRDGDKIGFSSNFTVYDTDDSKRVMKECMRQLDIEERFLPVKSILNEISTSKDSLISPQEYIDNAGNDIRKINIGKAYSRYQQLLKKADAMDFDDIIVNTVKLLSEHDDIREYYQNKFKYIMVDEYQDTNHAQFKLVEILASKRKNICVVGDDDQSIYKFRGATIENILNFENQYSNAKVIRLEQNYRSTQNILDAANSVISHNTMRKGKDLWTSNSSGELIVLNTTYDEQAEARFIADTIMQNVSDGGKWSDNTILYRMNSQSNAIENVFVRLAVPYRIIGGHRFYDRKEIKDAIAYLHVINNSSDDLRLKRIINEPKRGIGDTTVNKASEIATNLNISLYEVFKNVEDYPALSRASAKIRQFIDIMEEIINKQDSFSLNELLEYCLKNTGYIDSLALDKDSYIDRVENLNELSTNLFKYQEENDEPTLNGFLEEVSLMTDIDNYNSENDSVTMMTLHSAKGLEFPNVFIPGLEEGIFPGMQSMFSSAEIEEERRLAYVGITRAKERLYLSNANTRMLFGSTNHNKPSRFIDEIPSHLINNISKES
ncbi:MAG: UvrD-helicase domain-containing protein, partial [Clostridia bacterium]|nr:UvrD-helicase domain-containing protein [Clostridia bacterium]